MVVMPMFLVHLSMLCLKQATGTLRKHFSYNEKHYRI